ncbi:methionyl-tRNA formyltransferase [Modestobacter marinus]|uniref:methionyl-tRNA formyltransferase n=1 Tax=Modestobacter marinus TaxID=477641 RepID=UPI001C951060|nr:methionyl-tRNA formyltransferase [Modestobacter marinus]
MFAGTPAPAVVALEALLGSRHEVVAVLTRPDAPAGRGRRTSRSPVAESADAAGIPVLTPRSPREPEFLDQLRGLDVDCAPVVAYGALVPPEVLEVPRHGWVNLHFSLLPAWRGAAPVQHAIMAGDEVTGAATFRLEPGLDTGPVFGVVTEPIGSTDTAGDLLGRLAVSGARLLVATLDGIADGSLRPQPQPAEGVSLAPRIETADARVDWTLPAHVVDRRVRGVTPAPGAWTTWRGTRLRLDPVAPVPDAANLAPGEVSVAPTGVTVGTGRGAVRLREVQPAGKRMLPAADWARGARPAAGERLGE